MKCASRWAAGVLMSGLVAMSLSSSPAPAADSTSQSEITQDNWERHPRIVAVRKLYADIQLKLEKGELTLRKKDFSGLPRSCRGTYPLEYLSVATDKAGRLRIYTVAQRISHDDLMTTRNYYDETGRLRFVHITNESGEGFATVENRVYLTESGQVFWDVRSEAKKLSFGEIDSDSFEIDKTSTRRILSEFERTQVRCADRSK